MNLGESKHGSRPLTNVSNFSAECNVSGKHIKNAISKPSCDASVVIFLNIGQSYVAHILSTCMDNLLYLLEFKGATTTKVILRPHERPSSRA